MQLLRSDFTVRAAQWLRPRQAWMRFGFALGLTILYVLMFHAIMESVGLVGAAFVALPVGLLGWYFGVTAGLIAGLAGIILSASLLTLFEGSTWYFWIVVFWPGNLMVILIGYLAGRFQAGLADRSRIEAELRSRERYLAMINQATRDILDPKNSGKSGEYLVTHLLNIFGADHVTFVRWEAVQRQAILVASTKPPGSSDSKPVSDPDEATLTRSVLQSGHALVIEDVPNSPYVRDPVISNGSSHPTQSALVIPLSAGEYQLGAVSVTFCSPHPFTRQEITYGELAGNQIALALWSREQEFRIQKRLKEANALANIERLLSETEQVGLETVLQLIVDSAKELIPGAEQAVLHLMDPVQQILEPRAVAGIPIESKARLNMRLGEGVAGQVIATGEVIYIPDIQSDPRFISQTALARYRSLIVAPVQSNKRRGGTISIQSSQPSAFTLDEGRLLGALGTQAAIAIENANLLETTQQDLMEINALYSISQGLAASLDPDQLMKDVVGLLQRNFGYYHVQIYVIDPQSGDFLARQGSGKIGEQLKKQGYRLPVGAGIIGHVAETGEPFVTNDVDQVVLFIQNPLLPDTQSELAVPIKVEDRVVGVLDIQQTPPGRLTLRHLQLMIAVTDQLAVALQQANLYSELQTSLRQEKAMRSQLIQSERLAMVGRLLASVSHELNNPLQAIQNALFLLKDEKKLSGQGRQDLELVLSETERMAAMIERLRATYRPTRTGDFQEVQLNKIVEDVQALTATHMRHNEITFEFIPDPELPAVPGIPDQIRQVMLNLFMNAVEAMETGGHLTVVTRQDPGQERILLTVTDTGPGIDPVILPKIFEPFITGKESGTGLGLTITYDIVHQHKGDIQAGNNPGGGATFKVWLPMKKE
jgi:signal transduction histidine kinase